MRTVVAAARAVSTTRMRTGASYAPVYGLTLVVIGAAYWGLARITEPLAPAATHLGGLAGAFAAGAVVRQLLDRLRNRLRRAAHRRPGAEPEPSLPADRLGPLAHAAPGAAEALVTAITIVRETLGVPGAAVEAGGETYVSGEVGERPHLVPLVWHGQPVGQMLIGRAAPPGQQLDERLLGMLTLHLADVTHAVRLSTDLQRSRKRILSTREEERRRLRRDLHDGLGPTLASLAMSIDAARITLVKTPERVEPLLAELRERMATAIGDVRELVYELRPPALDDLGLEGAIRSLAGGSGGGPQVEVTFEGDHADLPAAVEVAAYRIVQEALTNIGRHAKSATALVRLRRAEELRIVVADDGAGLPPLLRFGGGLTAMRERAAELGGICVITPRAGGGTLVTARLPLTGEPEGRGSAIEERPSESAPVRPGNE
ncbi:MAG: hypothetical protein QOE54_5475 [Streptosporangiaceae bacterium]|jgi:two-component system NarL family sensor kinase|nr:histidine kinase [Streptosporangiaceae bacterium]MDX6433109.1 hypothetical protein [Streptosporangiaceae bacterium]